MREMTIPYLFTHGGKLTYKYMKRHSNLKKALKINGTNNTSKTNPISTALLISDQNPYVSKACYFNDNMNMIPRLPSFHGSIIKQINDAIKYVNFKYNNYWWIIPEDSPQRIERYDYPKKAIKEAILASYIYRDYTNTDSMFNSFYAYKNKLVISTPNINHNHKNVFIDKPQFNPNLINILIGLGYLKKNNNLVKDIKNAYQGTGKKPVFDKTLSRIILPNLNYGHV